MTEAIVERHRDTERVIAEIAPDILRYFHRRIENREDAADAASETLLVLWRKRRQLPTDPQEVRRYAFSIAGNVLQNTRRGARRRAALRTQVEKLITGASVRDPLPDIDLRRALAELAASDRELVLLVAWEGLSVAEAGRVLHLRPDAARARYSRARARLRSLLGGS